MEASEAETTASTGPSEAALRKARFELYEKDLPEVKEVCAQILGLKEGEEATQEDFDSSPDFQLRWVVDETHPPTVIGEHWIDHLDSEGRLAKCKANDFKFEDEWLPLYTRAGVTKQVSGLGSLLNTQGDSPLIAVIPPDMSFHYEQEYVIHQLHEAECLAWVSVYYGEFSMKWEEKVARLPLPPLAHREWTAASASDALLVWRPLVSFNYRDFWSLSIMETPGLLFII